MNAQNKLLQFAADTLTAWDAIIDQQDNTLHALLPPPLATQLALPEEVNLSTSPKEDHIPILYGEALLENLIELAQGDGRIAHIELTELTPRTSGLKGLLERTTKLHNAVGELRNTRPAYCTYFLYHFRFEATCHDLRYGDLNWIALNEESLTDASWLVPLLQPTPPPFKETPPPPWHTPFPQLETHLLSRVQQLASQHIEPFVQLVQRHISRHKRRLERQHRRERKQLLSSNDLDKEQLLQALQDAEQAYIQAVTPLPEQFPIQLTTEPYAALRISMPVTRAEYHIRRRKQERTISWIWNPLLDAFEPLPCEQCQRETFQLSATDDLQLLCHTCNHD